MITTFAQWKSDGKTVRFLETGCWLACDLSGRPVAVWDGDRSPVANLPVGFSVRRTTWAKAVELFRDRVKT